MYFRFESQVVQAHTPYALSCVHTRGCGYRDRITHDGITRWKPKPRCQENNKPTSGNHCRYRKDCRHVRQPSIRLRCRAPAPPYSKQFVFPKNVTHTVTNIMIKCNLLMRWRGVVRKTSRKVLSVISAN